MLVLVSVSGAVHAAPTEHPHHPVNFSFFYPIATNRDPMTSTNFRLNLVYGDIGSVRGVDLNGAVGRVRGDMVGFQGSGVYAHVAGELTGATASGFANYVKSDVKGMQYSGYVNFARADFVGWQFANAFNYLEGDMLGLQTTGIFNICNGDMKYFQYGTVANMVGGSASGMQAAGGLNYVNERMYGCQLALCNFAKRMEGAQIGLGNVAATAKGVQAGFVNIAGELDGVPVGVVNVTGEGDVEWVTFGSTLAAFSTGVRTIHRGSYSDFAIGIGDLRADRNDTAFLSWHYGYSFPLHRLWKLGFDGGFLHIVPTPSPVETVNDRLHYALQGRLLVELKISEMTRIFGGGGVSVIFSEYSSDASTETDLLVVLGVSVY